MRILINREKAIKEIQIVANKLERMGEPESAETFRNTIKILLRLSHESQWIPCDKCLPEENVVVLASGSQKGVFTARIKDGSWLNAKSHYCNPTAWMPLPEPYSE